MTRGQVLDSGAAEAAGAGARAATISFKAGAATAGSHEYLGRFSNVPSLPAKT